MKFPTFLRWMLLCCLLLSLASCVPSSPVPQKIDLKLCQVGGMAAQCGTLSVYENRAANRGRKIDIHVAVIKARGADPAPDPIFYIAGGPGGSAIDSAAYAMSLLRPASHQRDIVLVDQRGAGKSNQQTCPQPIEIVEEGAPMDEKMSADLRACLNGLDADPRAYTTAWAMDDLDDVRAALGYDKINLYGESYGPTAEQVYLQRHGEHVRTMTLEGVTLVDVPIFERFPSSSQHALDLLFDRCQANPACSAAYPELEAEFTAVADRLAQQPVELPVTNPRTGKPITFTREMLAPGIHGLLINTQTAVQIPYLVHQVYNGSWDAIAQTYDSNAAGDASSWNVMALTILCHEDWAKMRPEETAKNSAGSYMGYADLRRMTVPEDVCALVPRPQPEALYEPLTPSPAPVLIISNEADPQNPPENVAGAEERYPNSLTLVAPGQGHGYTGIPCRAQIVSEFIQSGTTAGLNTDCLQTEPLPAFLIQP